MDKIYSRKRLNFNVDNKMNKIFKILFIVIISITTASITIKSIIPIMDKQCKNIAKSIATKISNEQATLVMSRYNYSDICKVEKDSNGNITMISANVITINEIISDIPIKIQQEFDKTENSEFNIKFGSFTGSKILAGRGPNVKIKISTIGNLDTDLRSEFVSVGINQVLHKIYLQVDCNVSILTPYDTIEENISNQVLLAEAVIVGTTPNTYYNLQGLEQKDTLEVIE